MSNRGGLNFGDVVKIERSEGDVLALVLIWWGNELDMEDEGRVETLVFICKMLIVILY